MESHATWEIRSISVSIVDLFPDNVAIDELLQKLHSGEVFTSGNGQSRAIRFDLPDPKTTFFIFPRGKTILLPLLSIETAKLAVKTFLHQLQAVGLKLAHPHMEVEDLVVEGSLGFNLDLSNASKNLTGAAYVPKKHPNMVYKDEKTATIFQFAPSGKFFSKGRINPEELDGIIESLVKKLHPFKIP